MPPANSPSDTRPSTPPRYPPPELVNDSLSDNPYLRQLEEAISSPTPDLASTLINTHRPPSPSPAPDLPLPPHIPPSVLPAVSVTDQAWESRQDLPLALALDPAAENPGLELARAADEPFRRREYLTEREFQRWSPASRRRATMSSQRSRLRDTARQSYHTTGQGPVRQAVYDWIGGNPAQARRNSTLSDDDDDDDDEEDREDHENREDVDDNDDHLDGTSTAAPNTDISARRDLQRLERALQSYRTARNALRQTSRNSDFGPVPTASALRAYWNETDAERDHATLVTDLLRERSARHRRDWNDMHIQLLRDREQRTADRRTTDRRSDSLTSLSANLVNRPEKRPSEAFVRIRSTIRYLSQLRHTGVQGGLELARELGLDALYDSEDVTAPSDLPMHINSLPVPQYSSWLQPGMVWHGLQSTDRETPFLSSWDVPVRQEEQRLHLRMALARRREQERGVTAANSHPYILLGDLITSQSPSSTPRPPAAAEADHWPVKVTIHSVDYSRMTLSGTMSASHIPDKTFPADSSASASVTAAGASTSMSSFFTGEIIDFSTNPLETEPAGRDYRVGGLDTDARYWSRLGPFKREIERARHLRGRPREEQVGGGRLWEAFQKAASEKVEDDRRAWGATSLSTVPGSPSATVHDFAMGASADPTSSPSDSASTINPKVLTEDAEAEDETAMARALCSTRWLQKMGEEWILMRWKERCFVTPLTQQSSSSSSSLSTNPTAAGGSSRHRTILTTADGGAAVRESWGLTISGFYYVALNRLSGEIDGLYYDPGSQPYQQLKMVPEGMSVSGGRAGEGPSSSSSSSAVKSGCSCGCGHVHCKDRVGRKKWFPSIEYR